MIKEGIGNRISSADEKLSKRQEKAFHLERLRKKLQSVKSSEMHFGIKILLIYASLLAIASLVYVVFNLIRPNMIIESTPYIQEFEIVLASFSIFILYGLFERRRWIWVLSIVWFFAVMVYSLFLHYKMLELNLVQFEVFLLLSLFSLLMNSTIMGYIYLKKMYFTNIYFIDRFMMTDKVFVNIIISLLALLLAISITLFKVL